MNLISYITGIVKLKGDTDGTKIGNVNDSLKVTSTEDDASYIQFASNAVDLFGRLVTTDQYPLWSYSHRFGQDIDLYWDKDSSTGTATFTHSLDKAAQVITNTAGSGDTCDYRTFRYFQYSKGRQQSFLFTCNPKGTQTNVVKRFGAFDDKNGVFFELNGTTANLTRRSSTSGSAVDTKVAQASWNVDKMDGTGLSGITIDWDKLNLFYIDYSWLGTNAVEWGIFQNGNKYPMHREAYSNTLELAYSQSGNLPMCFAMENLAAVTAPTFEVGCIAVFSGGAQDTIGSIIDFNTDTTEVTVGTTAIIVGAIRMQSAYNRASLKIEEFSLFSPSGNASLFYQVLVGVDIVGGTYNPLSGSISEDLDTYTSFSGGSVIQSGYLRAGGENVIVKKIVSDLYIGREIDGTSQVAAVIAQTTSSNSKLLLSVRVREYS